MFGEYVIFYGACQSGNCPNVQKSPVTTVQVVEAPVYRPRLFQGLLRKERAVPVIVLTVPEEKKARAKK